MTEMAGDWIKLHRRLLDSFVNSDAGLMHLWINLLIRANWKPSWFAKKRIEVGQVAFSVGNFADVLKVSASTLRRRLRELESGGQINVTATSKFTIVTICNWRSYQEFIGPARRTDDTTLDATDDTASGEQAVHKRRTDDTHPKKLRREEGKKIISSQDLELANWMQSLIERMQPGRKPPVTERWAEEFRKLREIDNRTPEQIRSLYSWVNQDSFWRTNILSPQKLREKWDDLELKRTSGRNAKSATGESVRPTGSIFS